MWEGNGVGEGGNSLPTAGTCRLGCFNSDLRLPETAWVYLGQPESA
jgi:hypothetical protein